MEKITEDLIEKEIKKLNLKNEVVLKPSKNKKEYKPVNIFYSNEAIVLINKLSKYLGINKSLMLKNIINSRPLVKKINAKDLKQKSLKSIQHTLESNLTQLNNIRDFIIAEKATFYSFKIETIKVGESNLPPEKALDFFINNSKSVFDKFQKLKLKENDDKSDEVLELLEDIKNTNYICKTKIKFRHKKENRLYLTLTTDEYFNLFNHAIYLNENKLFIKNKDNVNNKNNLTAALWEMITKVEPKVADILITDAELIEIKNKADLFNNAIHKANEAKSNGIDFKSKDMYSTGVELYKTIKKITDKYSGV